MGHDTLATSLKTALGPGPYRSFRATSHALQLGDVSPDAWYGTASRAVRDADLLDLLVRSIPDAGVRSEVERAHRDRVDAGAGASTSEEEEEARVMGEKGSVAEVLALSLIHI